MEGPKRDTDMRTETIKQKNRKETSDIKADIQSLNNTEHQLGTPTLCAND